MPEIPAPHETILFADISRSTSFYDTLGDTVAKKLIGDCLKIMSTATTRNKGRVIKTIGDEIMCSFADASHAIEAACGMHQAVSQVTIPGNKDSGPVCIRVGIHTGPVIHEDNDVFGDTVNVAAHMVERAKPMHIITTEETVQDLPRAYHTMVRCIDRETVKGKHEELNIYEVVWQQQDLTMVIPGLQPLTVSDSCLKLNYHDQIVEVGRTKTFISIGRHLQNDIVVDDVLASRTHAKIEYRRGHFVFVDQSSNGTYVSLNDSECIQIRRGEMELVGSGYIGIGQDIKSASTEAIHFSILDV